MSTDYYRIASTLFNQMEGAKSSWEEPALLIDPELVELSDRQERFSGGVPFTLAPTKKKKKARKTCSRARTNARKLAASMMHNLTPAGSKWFRYDDGMEKQDQGDSDDDHWFAMASEIAIRSFSASNLYEVLTMAFYDRVFGTGAFLAEHEGSRLVFTHIPLGTYAIGQNQFNEVDTLVRKFSYTPHQAAEAFGLDALTKAMKEAYADDSRRYGSEFEIWHIVLPRTNAIAGLQDLAPNQRKWASIYLCSQDKKILKEDGYYEFPYCVTRFLRKGNRLYGTSPASEVLDEMRDLIKHREALSIIGQRQAIPSILTLAEEAGEIDMRAGGQTIISEKAASLGFPKEWAGGGRFDIGLNILEQYNAEIDNAFFIPIIEAIGSVDRQMTATQARLLDAERTLIMMPSFIQFVNDFSPLMRRVLALLLRAGDIPRDTAPDSVLKTFLDEDKNERVLLLSPNVSYLGPMAQAIDSAQKISLDGTLQEMIAIAQSAVEMGLPNPFEHIDLDYLTRWRYTISAAPIKGLKPRDQVADERQQKQEAAMQMQAAQMQQIQAAANRDNAQAAATEQAIPPQ